MKKNFKRPLVIILIIVIIFAALGAYFYYGRKTGPSYETTTVLKGNLRQLVSVTGRVTPTQNVNLAFSVGGRVASAPISVNDKVTAGQVLATLDNADIKAQIAQAQANLATQQAKLDELKRGTRLEDLQITQTSVTNAQKSLADAQSNLLLVENSANASLNQIYNSAITAANKSVAVGINSLFTLTDIQYAHFMNSSRDANTIAVAKADAISILLGTAGAGLWTKDLISQLNGGAEAEVQNAQNNPSATNINQALIDVAVSLNKVKTALDSVPFFSELTLTEIANLNTEKSNINTEVIAIAAKQQAIDVQKTTNDYNIKTAQIALTSAQNTLAAAQSQLALKQAGTAPEQISAQDAQVKSAQASIVNLQAQLGKTVISSPLNGIITVQNAKVGQIVSPNTPVISIISAGQFEIEANVPEADIAKVRTGESAKVTLDAYGSDIIFDASVVEIDPAETIIEGVATYQIKFQFAKEDERIKSGMTANIDILSAERQNVLIIPQRAVIEKNNEKFVLINLSTNQTQQRQITTGLKGSDGNIEIVSGLNEGEKIVSFGGTIQ